MALQVLGSSLPGKSPAEWEEVIKKLKAIERTLPQTKQIQARCQPSYDALPPHLQQCFMDFAAYPEDARVPERELASLWAATATVPQGVEWGRQQLEELKLRSLVLQDSRGVYVHDILRDLAVIAATDSHDHYYWQMGEQDVVVPAAKKPFKGVSSCVDRASTIIHCASDPFALSAAVPCMCVCILLHIDRYGDTVPNYREELFHNRIYL
jgi:hypothetical protein